MISHSWLLWLCRCPTPNPECLCLGFPGLSQKSKWLAQGFRPCQLSLRELRFMVCHSLVEKAFPCKGPKISSFIYKLEMVISSHTTFQNCSRQSNLHKTYFEHCKVYTGVRHYYDLRWQCNFKLGKEVCVAVSWSISMQGDLPLRGLQILLRNTVGVGIA